MHGKERDAVVEWFFAEPDRYLAGNPDIAVRARILRLMLGDCTDLDILDLGCGDGTLSLQFLDAARSVTLVDRSRRMLDAARRNTPRRWRHKVEYLERDLARFRVSTRYDVVLCVGVLAHVPDASTMLGLVADAVDERGRLVVQLSDADRRLARLLRRYADTRRRLSRAPNYATNAMTATKTRSCVERHGLELCETRYYSSVPPGFGWLPAAAADSLVHAAWTRPRLSCHGSEALMLFCASAAHGAT